MDRSRSCLQKIKDKTKYIDIGRVGGGFHVSPSYGAEMFNSKVSFFWKQRVEVLMTLCKVSQFTSVYRSTPATA